MSMGFTPINAPRVDPPILKDLEAKKAAAEASKVRFIKSVWDEPEKSSSQRSSPIQPSLQRTPPATAPPTYPSLQSLPSRPAPNDLRATNFVPSRAQIADHPTAQPSPPRIVPNGTPMLQPRVVKPLSELPPFDRGKLRPSSDVHPMTDWLRDLPDEIKQQMNLGTGPDGEPVFSFREWEHQKLSSVSPYVLEKLREAIRRDVIEDNNTGKRRPNQDIRELLIEWDCNFDDYEDIDAWERKFNMPVVFAWLCVRKMRVAINNKKAMWLKDLLAEDPASDVTNGSEKRPRPVSMVAPPLTDFDIKRMKTENHISPGISTGFTNMSSMPTPPNDGEQSTGDRGLPRIDHILPKR